ncbi:DivIVA domain-containing protein [Streptomyces sp. NPDC090073]|uniref:DivIVA domain-containing protein n=1 Tax=Streptomyces sp. NPDC090073 TaxID=3365936 RepID=UPI0038087AA7
MAYWEALHDFADELNAFHISCGAPSYRDIAKASHEPKLSQAGITEFLKGRRLPQLKALMEFIRVLSLEPHAATGEAASPDVVRQEWRERWTHVRGLQRQAQDPLSHLKTTVKATLDQAEKEAEALRTAARAEASRIRADAEAGADRLTAEAREQADELLERARERAEGLRADDETAEPDKAAPTRLLRLRRLLSRPAPVAAAAVLAVSGSVLGVVLFYGQAPGPCKSASNDAPSSAWSATDLGLQPMGAVAKEQEGAKRLPDSWITNWHLPSGTPAGQSTSASAPSSAAPSATASATPRHPAGSPSASSTSSAGGCR